VGRIQDTADERDIALDRVGITGLRYPLRVPSREGDAVADCVVSLHVSLSRETRATHMSRFVATLETHRREVLDARGIERLLTSLRDSLDAEAAFVEIEHTHYVEKQAPETKATSLLACDVARSSSLDSDGFDHVLSVRVPVHSVCPCSMEMTGGASHSQRGHVAVALRAQGRVAVEDIVAVVEASASAPLFPLLRGSDERRVIESAHDRPVLVEDLARNVAERLDSDVRVLWYSVEARNQDSVHAHDACASVTRRPTDLGQDDGPGDRPRGGTPRNKQP